MKVCILGSSGNMGRRYASICDFLDIAWHPCDPASDTQDAWMQAQFTHFIIATPTEHHLGDILKIRSYAETKTKPVLCEKPVLICPDQTPLGALSAVVEMNPETYMVNNYRFVDFYDDIETGNDHTMYAYYNSGPHGILWDCIQLVYLAKSTFIGNTQSPRWFAQINGRVVSRASIDASYIEMLKAFVYGQDEYLWGPKHIVEAHRKVVSGRNIRDVEK